MLDERRFSLPRNRFGRSNKSLWRVVSCHGTLRQRLLLAVGRSQAAMFILEEIQALALIDNPLPRHGRIRSTTTNELQEPVRNSRTQE
jgi:hypothetical protein